MSITYTLQHDANGAISTIIVNLQSNEHPAGIRVVIDSNREIVDIATGEQLGIITEGRNSITVRSMDAVVVDTYGYAANKPRR